MKTTRKVITKCYSSKKGSLKKNRLKEKVTEFPIKKSTLQKVRRRTETRWYSSKHSAPHYGNQLHAPAALPPKTQMPEPTKQEDGWTPKPAWTRWRRGKTCLCRKPNLGCPARSLRTIQPSDRAAPPTKYI